MLLRRMPRWPLTASLTGAVAISVAAHAGALLALRSFGEGGHVRTDSAAPPVQLLAMSPEPSSEQPTPPRAEPTMKLPEPPLPEPSTERSPPATESVLSEPAPLAPVDPAPAPAQSTESRAVPQVREQASEPASGVVGDSPQRHVVSFAGVEGVRASRIAYVLDASGPMTSCLPLVKSELLQSVSRLASVQRFRVIVTRRAPGAAQPVLETFPSSGFSSPTPAELTQLAVWLADVQPRGASDPWSGLEASITSDPELVFLLTRSIRRSAADDVAAANERTLARLDALNPRVSGRRAVVIKSLQFVDEDPSGLLQRIAELHGDGDSSYRVISMQELGTGR